MLVLSRRPGEKIRVGSTVFTVLSVRVNRVQIGIEAPSGVRIQRYEVKAVEDASKSPVESRELVLS